MLVDLLDQLALVPLTRGSLVLVEAPEAASLDEIVASAGRAPDVLLVHRFGVADSEQSRDMTAATSVLSNVPEETAALLTSIVGVPSFSVLPLAETPATRTFVLAHVPSVPISRSIRRGRELALAMLLAEAMLAETAFSWGRLAVDGSPLYNLYDAEGTGGAGPGALVRITEAQLPGARVVRVCGEDVRDGSLAAAIGLLVPGGSGRGIAEGLGETGQNNVRLFVESGGGYVGICAGAYLATCRVYVRPTPCRQAASTCGSLRFERFELDISEVV